VSKRAFYFGYGNDGHFLRDESGWRSTLTPGKFDPTFPWAIGLLDTGLLKNRKVPDDPDGRVHWTCGGRDAFWFAFFWWDRSGDTRSGSNSGFYVRWPAPDPVTREGTERLAVEAFAFACDQYPAVVARQHQPLVLYNLP
jgi:hypothetical protein